MAVSRLRLKQRGTLLRAADHTSPREMTPSLLASPVGGLGGEAVGTGDRDPENISRYRSN